LNQHGVQQKPLLLAYVKHANDVARYLDLFPEQQSVLKKKTSAHGSPWTKEDVRELKTHSKARTPLPSRIATGSHLQGTGGFLARKAANDVHYDNSTIATASAAKSEIPF
jgi:hypothetical protein